MTVVPGLPAVERLLVPLDGSRLAEAALSAAQSLALRFGARGILIHVLERRPPASVHGDRHLMDAAESQTYLQEVAARLVSGGVAPSTVEVHVHDAPEDDLAGSVVEHAEEFAPDLVILCSHGSGGIRGLLFGSIAQQVLQRGTRPVLVVQPTARPGLDEPPFKPHRVLVPLDGEPDHEAALALAVRLAQAFGAELDLVSVVPTLETLSGEKAATGVLLPSATRAVLDMSQQDAAAYLTAVSERLRDYGLPTRTDVLRGDTVHAVLQHAERTGADLLALTSHGRVGLDALLSGSVAPRIVARFSRPLLLVRA